MKNFAVYQNRNIGIKYIREHNLIASYVMFPDDDSTFDKEFFDNFVSEVYSDTLINVFCEGTNIPYQKMPQLNYLEKTNNYQNAMSVNMIIQYDHFIEIGFLMKEWELVPNMEQERMVIFFLESVNDLDLLYLISIYTHFIRLPIRNLQQFL